MVDERAPITMPTRPISVTIISWLLIAAGALGLVYHLMDFRTAPFQVEIIWISLVRVLAIAAGIFMLRGCDWARWLALAWIAFHVAISVFHSVQQTIVHVLFLGLFGYFLLRRDAGSYFRSRASAR
jgi:hypothetical protein